MILLVLLTMLHTTLADEKNEGYRNVTFAAYGSWTDTCAVIDPQVLPICHRSDMYSCSFIDVFLDIVWQYEEQLLYGILSAIMLLIICYWKFGNFYQGGSGDNHNPVDDGNGAVDDDRDLDEHYDAKNNVVRFSNGVSETRPYSPSLPGFSSSVFIEKESDNEVFSFSNHVVMTQPAPMIFIAITQPTCTSMIHFQCNNGLILNCPIKVIGPPSAEHKPSYVPSLADNIDQKEETQDVSTSCHTEVLGCPPYIPNMSESVTILTLGRNLLFLPAPIFLILTSGISSHGDNTNTVAGKGYKEKTEDTLDCGGEENFSFFLTSPDKESKVSPIHRPTLSESLPQGNEEQVVDLGGFLASTCAVDMISAPREEPIDKLPSADSNQEKVVSEDGDALQQSGDSLDSLCLLPPPVFRPRDFLCSMDDSFIKYFRSDYG